MSTFKRILPMIILCIFEALAGILILSKGADFFKVVFIISGIFLLVVGLITLIRSLLAGRKGGSIPMLPMIVSLFMIGFGALFTAASGAVLAFMTAFTMVYGCIMLINGIFKIVEYFQLRKEGIPAGFVLFDAIVTILLGLLLAFNPLAATLAEWIIVGVALIVSAIFDVIATIVLAVQMKKGNVAVVEVKVEKVADGAKETVATEGKEVKNETK